MTIGYATDIRPLFRVKDVSSMKKYGPFDLSLYEDVKANADAILQQLEAGSMPCDGAWSAENIGKFRDWIAEGKLP
jgi:hypothetical protein